MPEKTGERLLLIDDDVTLLENLQALLTAVGYETDAACSPAEALNLIASEDYSLVITDLKMPGTDGLCIYEAIRDVNASVPVIVLTGYGSADEAANAIKMGCTDYLRKPVTLDELRFRIEKARRQHEVEVQVASLRAELKRTSASRTIVGSSVAIRLVLAKIAMVAKSDASVLITGETGTGKELVARAIHENSDRASYPFIAVACAAIPHPLLEGQLFGHKKGAYTGADRDQEGLIALAHRGALFLDEVGDIDITSQVKLLRVLETGELRPLGDKRVHKVDIRLIAATNRDLEKAINEEHFRADLFYRLNVFPIHLPPLRDRGEDIPLLVSHFAELHGPVLCGHAKTFSPGAVQKLMAYKWPGNVRELENKVRQAMLVAPGDAVGPSAIDLPVKVKTSGSRRFRDAKNEAVAVFERQYVEELLTESGGVISEAARLAGLDRKNFWLLMKKHDVNADEHRQSKAREA